MNRRQTLLGMAAMPLVTRASFGASRGADVKSVITKWANANRFAGVVSLGHAGRTTASHAFGLASVEDRTPATPNTRYAFGSVSKWFVTTAVLRLCDRGALRLDAPIGTYLTSIKGDAGTKVELVHLLSNTSGIPDGIVEALKTALSNVMHRLSEGLSNAFFKVGSAFRSCCQCCGLLGLVLGTSPFACRRADKWG